MLKKPIPLLLKLADKTLPLGQHIPFTWQKHALEKGLNKLFANALEDGLFDVLEGRWLRIFVEDLRLSWYLSKCQQRSQLVLARYQPAEVAISGNWREFLLLASRQEDPDTLFFRRRLRITGDTELGLAIKNLIDGMDPDQLPPWLWQSMTTLGEQIAQQGHASRL